MTAALQRLQDAEMIYRAYPKPRQVYRPRALRAIERVLKAGKITADELLARTKAYAKSVQWRVDAGPDMWQWIPHAASWFNAEGYNNPLQEHNANPKDVGRIAPKEGKYEHLR